MRELVEAQRDVWFVIPQFLGFLVFVVAGVAVTHRHPFDQPEAEQELAEGYHVEYGGMKWGMFFVAEYVNVVLISALIVIRALIRYVSKHDFTAFAYYRIVFGLLILATWWTGWVHW